MKRMILIFLAALTSALSAQTCVNNDCTHTITLTNSMPESEGQFSVAPAGYHLKASNLRVSVTATSIDPSAQTLDVLASNIIGGLNFIPGVSVAQPTRALLDVTILVQGGVPPTKEFYDIDLHDSTQGSIGDFPNVCIFQSYVTAEQSIRFIVKLTLTYRFIPNN